MPLSFGRSIVSVLVLASVHPMASLAAPSEAMKSMHSARFRPADFRNKPHHPRQEDEGQTVATYFGFFGAPANTQVREDGQTVLRPLEEVFMAMTRDAEVTQASATTTSAAISSAIVPFITAPPKVGPGIVLVPASSIGLSSAGPSSPTISPIKPTSAATSATSRFTTNAFLVLALVVAGIVIATLCLFLIMDPRFVQALCSRRRRPGTQTRPKSIKAPSLVSTTPSWKTHRVPPPRFTEEDEKVFNNKQADGQGTSTRKKENSVFHTTSKFSASNSDYDTTRDSYGSTLSARSDEQIQLQTTPLKGVTSSPIPSRPPRPPTSDSPALSDSVYLACGDRPYFIVEPQALSDKEGRDLTHPSPSSSARSRILTPSEFAAMYASGALTGGDSIPILPPGLNDQDSNTDDEENRHSRTHSAPTPMFLSSSQPSKAAEEGEETDSTLNHLVAKKIQKHRRSRSASGWAYPPRTKTREETIS